MPRRKRNYLARVPYHLVQRGNSRQRCFRSRDDFSTYLNLWREKSHWYGVDVHAYCLMPNHIHFIVSSTASDAISNTMKVVGSRYAYYFNRRHKRTGTLWEGRHRSSLIDAVHYSQSAGWTVPQAYRGALRITVGLSVTRQTKKRGSRTAGQNLSPPSPIPRPCPPQMILV